MTTITILLATACIVFLIALFLKCKENERLNQRMEEITNIQWNGITEKAKRYRRKYTFVNIRNAGDNGTLNSLAETYYDAGFDLDREKSTDRLLVFTKLEEVKE